MNMQMLKTIYRLLLFAFSVLWASFSQGNTNLYVEAKPGADSIKIGGQTNLVFLITTTRDFFWQWPDFTDRISEKVEIVTQTGIDTLTQRKSELITLRKELIITSFDSGYHAVAPFNFRYKSLDDTVWTNLETLPFLLYVEGFEVDMSASIRDIKGPVRAPVTFSEILPWLLAAIALSIGIWLYFYYLKKKRERILLRPKPVKPGLPPHTIALDALDALRSMKLWQNGKVKEYHSELTDIIRQYLEGRYKVMAPEMTSSEIMEAVYLKPVPNKALQHLQIIFERADLVKFAKSLPLPAEHEESLMFALEFIRATIPMPGETAMKSDAEKEINNTENKQ